MKKHKFWYLVVVFNLFTTPIIANQQFISLQALMDQMEACQADTCVFQNLIIYGGYSALEERINVDSVIEPIIINRPIKLINCVYQNEKDSELRMHYLEFKNDLIVKNWKSSQFNWRDCTFHKDIILDNLEIESGYFDIVASNRVIVKNTHINNVSPLVLSSSLKFNIREQWYPDSLSFSILSKDTVTEETTYRRLDLPTNFNDTYKNHARLSFIFQNCTIDELFFSAPIRAIELENIDCLSIEIHHSTIYHQDTLFSFDPANMKETISYVTNLFLSEFKNVKRLSLVGNEFFPSVLDEELDEESEIVKFLNLTDLNLSSLVIKNNKLNNGNISLKGVNIYNSFEFIDNDSLGKLGLQACNFPEGHFFMDWEELPKYGLNYYVSLEDDLINLASLSENFEISSFKKLTSLYNNFLQQYEAVGDRASRNACYAEMKELENLYHRNRYQNKPSTQHLFNFRVNQFLSFFCDYGTNPAKSILISFYVILAFAAIYFLFPSESDNLSRTKLINRIAFLSSYLDSDKGLGEIRENQKRIKIAELKELEELLRKTHNTVPGIINILGKPIHDINMLYLRLSTSLLNTVDFSNNQWQTYSPTRKMGISLLTTIYFVAYLLWGIFIRGLNALVLSINSFVTLGYGEISANGIARYLVILQGLIGWFLLTVFSVTLISQVIQ